MYRFYWVVSTSRSHSQLCVLRPSVPSRSNVIAIGFGPSPYAMSAESARGANSVPDGSSFGNTCSVRCCQLAVGTSLNRHRIQESAVVDGRCHLCHYHHRPDKIVFVFMFVYYFEILYITIPREMGRYSLLRYDHTPLFITIVNLCVQ